MARGLVCIATGRYVRLVGDLVRACSRSGIVDRLFCLTDDPASLQRRASRGGAWRHHIKVSTCASRSSIPPDFRYADYGFRVAGDI
jgi:formylglycine-generating enzyme required for sulfatase activity